MRPTSFFNAASTSALFAGNRLRHRTALFLGMVLLAILAFGSVAQGQEAGQILGTVTDPSGAVVPNATVKRRSYCDQ
jgi:hypothetical protein